MSYNILLVNFDFPPNDGIGGRRWGKLAKALAEQGNIVHVVKAESIPGKENSPWSNDVLHSNIHIYSIPRTYPIALSHPTSSLFGKVVYWLLRKKLTLTTSGTIYDQSIGWNRHLTPTCERLIAEHRITKVIATGAPWNLLVYTSALKNKNPEIKLLVDYRDPWLTAVNYGMLGLSKKRMNAEIEKQRCVFAQADIVTTPYPYLTEELQKWSTDNVLGKPQFATLPHFFDESDFKNIQSIHRNNDSIKIIYAGDIYASSENNWKQLVQRIQEVNKSSALAGKTITIDIYTAAKPPVFTQDCSFINLHKPTGKAIFEKIVSADICLVVQSNRKKDELTTKFFEYLRCRKPILVVAPDGELSRFVVSNKLGIHLNDDNSSLIALLLDTYRQNTFDNTFNLAPFELRHRCEQLLKLIH